MKLNSTALNFLRVFAAALVFFCHSTIVAGESFGLELHGLSKLINTPAWGGVWIFLIIGGFLAAYGFDSHKYILDKSGILEYYKGRFLKVLMPTWFFLSLMYIFNLENAHLTVTEVLRYLTCTFNGSTETGGARIGATWYVFVIMWLYLLVPVLLKALNWFEKRHKGNEYHVYLKLIAAILIAGIIYRVGGVFLWHQIGYSVYYNWFYANVTGTLDLFVIGMIGERIMTYLPEISDDKVKQYRKFGFWAVIIVAVLFTGNYRGQRTLYLFLAPSMFALSTVFMIVIYSYKSHTLNSYLDNTFWGKVVNALAPYTFMFYLWHSPILGWVADKINMTNVCIHYIIMLAIGGIITAYIAYLMKKMNDNVIKSVQTCVSGKSSGRFI